MFVTWKQHTLEGFCSKMEIRVFILNSGAKTVTCVYFSLQYWTRLQRPHISKMRLFSLLAYHWVQQTCLSIPWCCPPTFSFVCLVFFPLSLCLQSTMKMLLTIAYKVGADCPSVTLLNMLCRARGIYIPCAYWISEMLTVASVKAADLFIQARWDIDDGRLFGYGNRMRNVWVVFIRRVIELEYSACSAEQCTSHTCYALQLLNC